MTGLAELTPEQRRRWPPEPLEEWSADERVSWVFHQPDEAQYTPREEAMLQLRDADRRAGALEELRGLKDYVERDMRMLQPTTTVEHIAQRVAELEKEPSR